MENTESKPSKTDKPSKNRSGKERAIVWVGILLLIGVVFLEWKAREDYEKAYKELESAINTRDEKGVFKGIDVDAVNQHVRGFVFRSDRIDKDKTTPVRGEPVEMERHRIYCVWPSVFKRYEFRLLYGKDNNKIIHIEPVIASNK